MFNIDDFTSLDDNTGLIRGPLSTSEFDMQAGVGGIVAVGSYFCDDVTKLAHSELCRPPGERDLVGNTFTFSIPDSETPAFTDWPSIGPETFVIPGATLNDFTPPPAYMIVRLQWDAMTFRSYHNGCYIDPDDGQPKGCGPSVLNRPRFSVDVGDLALDVMRAEDEAVGIAYRTGLEHGIDPTSGTVDFVSEEDADLDDENILLPPNSAEQFATIAPHHAFVKIPDAVDLGSVGGYTDRLDNDASRYLIPWGSLDSLTVSWPDEAFGQITAAVNVYVTLFWEYDWEGGATSGALMDLV